MVDILLLFSNSGDNGKDNLDNLIKNIVEIAKILGISKESDEFKSCLLHELGRDPRHNNKKYLSSLVSGGIGSVIKELLKTDRYKEIWANKEKNALDKILYGCVEKIEKESNTKEDVQNPGEVKTSSENVSAANVQKKGLPPKISDWEKKDIDNLVDAIIMEITNGKGIYNGDTPILREFARVLNIEPNTNQWNSLKMLHTSRAFSDIPIDKVEEYSNQVINSHEEFKKVKQSGIWNYSYLVCFVSAIRQKVEKEIGTPRVQEFAKALKIKPGTPQWHELVRAQSWMEDIPINKIEEYSNQVINSSEFFKGLKQSATWNYSNLLCFISAVWQKVEKEIGSPKVQEFAKVLKIKPGTPQWECLLSNERKTRNFNRIPIDVIKDYTEQFIKLHKND